MKEIIRENRESLKKQIVAENTVLVLHGRFATPDDTFVYLPSAKKKVDLPTVLNAIGSRFDGHFLFSYPLKDDRPTGCFRRGARQEMADSLKRPTIFYSERKTIDERPYTQWRIFYPRSWQKQEEWTYQTELQGKSEAVVRAKRQSAGFKWPAIVHIPNFPYVLEAVEKDAQKLFLPDVIDTAVNEIGRRQMRLEFDPLEIKLGLRRVLQMQGEPFYGKAVDVPGAFVGKFAEAVSETGLRVRASDALKVYADNLKEKGLEARQTVIEKLPKMNGGKLASIAFELYPVVGGETCSIVMLREFFRSERGLVFVQHKDCLLPKYVSKLENDYNEFQGELDAFAGFAGIYGLSLRIVDTDSLRFMCLDEPTEEQRRLMKADLLVLYELRKAVWRNRLYDRELEELGRVMTSRIIAFPKDELILGMIGKKVGLTANGAKRSLHRINAGTSLVEGNYDEEDFEEEKEKGGRVTILRLLDPREIEKISSNS